MKRQQAVLDFTELTENKAAQIEAFEIHDGSCIAEQDVPERLSQTEGLERIRTENEAIYLLKQEKKNAGWLLNHPKIRGLLRHVSETTGLKKEGSIDFHYRLSGRRPSFCLGIDWQQGLVTDYEARRELGRGGNGVVRQFSNSYGQTLAVKSMPYENLYAADEDEIKEQCDELRDEVEFIRQAYPENHDSHLFFAASDSEKHYASRIIMPVVPGERAGDVFNKPLSERTAVSFILLMTRTLISLHEKGIIHGDIKENNLYIDSRYKKAQLIDFGWSYAVTASKARITHDKTVDYFAPERICPKGDLKPHTNQDVFSFGIMLRDLINNSQALQKLIKIYPSINTFIHSGLDENPDNRPTLQSFHDQLFAEWTLRDKPFFDLSVFLHRRSH